ncbi:MAG: DUF3127 domain-containing protein [Bacteroidia bacterium]|nr:DUF3127 domain-containing protein [Bacteroidia bacterium]
MEGAPTYELKGTLHAILPRVSLGRGRFKVPFVVLSDTATPQFILMEAHEEMADNLQKIPLGERIRVRFVIEGWLWHPPYGKSRFITRLRAVELERLSA